MERSSKQNIRQTGCRNTIEQAVKVILEELGEDTEREGLKGTPDRVARALHELTAGYYQDASEILSTTFSDEIYDEMVLLRDISFCSTCEHHMQSVQGIAHVAYIPNKRIVGLSKLARLVDCFALRLQIQERLTVQITEALMEHLKPKGAACVIEATHGCMTCRGVKKQNAKMITSCLRGVFNDPDTRAEFLSFVKS